MRKKKVFPEGTFIPTPQRSLAIIQLCMAFSLILWIATQPFMGEYFTLKSKLLIYEYVIGISDAKKEPLQIEKARLHAEKFSQLPENEQIEIEKHYKALSTYSTRPFWIKIGDGLIAFFFKMPIFQLAWIFFSVLIPILILLKFDEAKKAAWLLPLIVLAYSVDSRMNGNPPKIEPDSVLFPTENIILSDYIKQPLAFNWEQQRNQLKFGWEQYLITNWSNNNQDMNKTREENLEDSEYNFTLARLKLIPLDIPTNWTYIFHEKTGHFVLFVYYLWNFFFAWMMNRPVKPRKATIKNPILCSD